MTEVLTVRQHIEALQAIMKEDTPIEVIEKGWNHFYSIESHFDAYFSDDKAAVEIISDLKSALSTFTRDVRENMPSPYTGFRMNIFRVEKYLFGGFDKNDWPK